MEQLYIVSAAAIDSSTTAFTNGKIAFFHLSAPATSVSGKALSEDFGFVVGRGADKMPLRFDEVNFKSLTVKKSGYQEGVAFTTTVTIPTATVDKAEYTIMVVKKDVVRHERNTWTYTQMAKGTANSSVVADALRKAINANTETSGVKATGSGATVTITAVTAGVDYNVVLADALQGASKTTTQAKPEMCGTAYLNDLQSRCAGGRSVNYRAEDGKEIYPGYPEVLTGDKGYDIYTLRFAVPRIAAKTRDEVVNQIVHIAVPRTNKNTEGELLDVLLGLKAASSGSTGG